ncbi:MAG: TorF family putative porin [Luteimonas sp.]
MHPLRVPRCPRGVATASLLLAAPFASAADVGGHAALTSDYVWRGTSQSDEGPAVQAGFKRAADSGLYAQAWVSSVESAPQSGASTELDLVAGWSGGLGDSLALDVNLTHYLFPSTAVDLDWTETVATLTWQDRYWFQLAHSNDALASGATGTYAQLGARLPLNGRLRLEAAAGHYRLADASGYDDYTHLQVGAVWAVAAPVELRVTAHDTDAAAERGFGPWAGSRFEAALQVSF